MRTCSHCRRTYPDRSRRCPVCGTFLLGLHRPPEPRLPTSTGSRRAGEGLVVICHCGSAWEADFVRNLLEAEGIPVAQRPTPLVSSVSYLPPMTGGIQILVRHEDTEAARDLLLAGRQDVPGE